MKKTPHPLLQNSTADWVIGSDEVGYGAWAGPLVVCAVALPRAWDEPGITDSKKLSAAKRAKIYDRWVLATPVRHQLVEVSSVDIDRLGIWAALTGAHRTAIEGVRAQVQGTALVVVDGFPDTIHHIGVEGAIGLPKADALVPSVSVASVIAKVTRDRLMERMSVTHPGYGFSSNVGYGTPEHQSALNRLGICAIHRKSYQPVAAILGATPEELDFEETRSHRIPTGLLKEEPDLN